MKALSSITRKLPRTYHRSISTNPPITDLCPSPSCACRPTPQTEKPLNRDRPLLNTKPYYSEHVIISTGNAKWPSRPENDVDYGAVFGDLHRNFRPPERQQGVQGLGKYYNPSHSVLISMSDFQPSDVPPIPKDAFDPSHLPPVPKDGYDVSELAPISKYGIDELENAKSRPPIAEWPTQPTSIFCFPSGYYLTLPAAPVPQLYHKLLDDVVSGYVLPWRVQEEYARFDPKLAKLLVKNPKRREDIPWRRKVNEVVVFICGHMERDERCGNMGPVLKAEFEEKFEKFDHALLKGEPVAGGARADILETEHFDPFLNDPEARESLDDFQKSARVALISHIGGHHFAGNVIIYLPTTYAWRNHPLTGMGIWYGRVEPWHVEGIIEQTIVQGNIIGELYRGAVTTSGTLSFDKENEKRLKGIANRAVRYAH